MKTQKKLAAALLLAAVTLATLADRGWAAEKVVVQYDCIPNYANWGGVTALYEKVSGVKVPPDDKGSSVAMAALEKEKEHPQADCAYYSGAIGLQAAQKGLHQPYKPRGCEVVPAGLKAPN